MFFQDLFNWYREKMEINNSIHKNEKDQFIKLFEQEKIDGIENRIIILDAFLHTEEHITLDKLDELPTDMGHTFEMVFIRNTLDLMCKYGFAHMVQFENRPALYEHRHLGQHHDHMVCTKCGKIIEFHNDKLELLQEQIASTKGFHMLQHKLELYGICSDCVDLRVKTMPLMMAKPGDRLIIRSFASGKNCMKHLQDMGLRVGDNIEILTSQGKGQFVIAADSKRFVLGYGMAQKIEVEIIEN
jgi:Fur family ferric uptake transcriptional regulator